MREDETGAYYEAELFDADYADQLLPALRAGQLGASFRFSVADQEWITPAEPSRHNPERLEERTITKIGRLYEFGPVTWGAYPQATAGMRSATDQWHELLRTDPLFAVRYADQVGTNLVERLLTADTPAGSTEQTETQTTPEVSRAATPEHDRTRLNRQAELVRLMSVVRYL